MSLWDASLFVSAVVTALLTVYARRNDARCSSNAASADFRRFQGAFMVVYFTSLMADWLQGPYVYALYDSYGFSRDDIEKLFVGGFGSSMLFGTFVGALADKYGRKLHCQIYCVLYILSCVTKHYNGFWVLMGGRVLGGIATSLLFSAFEAWMVCEHNTRGFKQDMLGTTFSITYFGNFLVAILAGLSSQPAVDATPLVPLAEGSHWHRGAALTAFDMSAGFCFLALVLTSWLWNENYGSQAPVDGGWQQEPSTAAVRLADAGETLKRLGSVVSKDPCILLCGAVVSLFEGSMYVFIFNWSPALMSLSDSQLPFGRVFTVFMVCCMGGSSLSSALSEHFAPQSVLVGVFAMAAACLVVPIFSSSQAIVLLALSLFEACVGVYWPAIGTIKGNIVPEEVRAAVYNCFRVPLNIIVVAVLLTNLGLKTSFFLCSLMLACAAACQLLLCQRMRIAKTEQEDREMMLKDCDAPSNDLSGA